MLLTILLAWIAVLASGDLHAQAHGPPASAWKKSPPNLNDPVQRAAMMAKLDTWLRRLVGNFRYEGIVQFGFEDERPVSGTRDCFGIGEGPGVLCVINMTWREIGPNGNRGPYSYLKPAMALYGIGPSVAEISFLQVDDRGLPEGVPAKLRDDDVVRFQVPCVNESPVCRRIVRIKAGPDGVPIDMRIDTWGNYFGDMAPAITYLLTLVPIPQVAAEDVAQAPPAAVEVIAPEDPRR
jgi:hypothetical protein